MESTFTAILQHGLTWPLAFSLLQLLVIFFIATAIKNFLTNSVNRMLAYRRAKKNNYLRPGSWVRWPTTTGSVITKVDAIYPNKVVLQTKNRKEWIHVPILQFINAPVCLLETDPKEDDKEE